ncbi:MAG: heparinase II/III-family protein [Planctomycetes bacterium]|nr:heparinase II/III-family protein [Planctomycetota bacterium]
MSDRIKLILSPSLTHPFLIDRATLADLPRRAAIEPTKSAFKAMLTLLEETFSKPLPTCPPGGLIDPPVAFYSLIGPLSHAALGAAVAWHAEHDAKWIKRATDALAELARWEFWRAPVHLPLPADLTTAHTALETALAYDLLYDQLAPELRRNVQDAILRHATAFILPETIDRQWWSWAHDGNWSFVTLGGMGAATLAIFPERSGETRAAVETAAGHLQRSYDHIHPTGSWREGHGYAIYGFSYGQVFLDALANAGDRRLADHPGPAALDDFFLFTMLTPTRQVAFGDNPADGGAGPVLYRRAALTKRGDLQELTDRFGHGGPMAILWRDPSVTPRAASFDPPSRSWPDIGWTIMREDWNNPNAVALAAKAGSVAGGHQHWDCGTFLLASHGVELVTEPGIGNYSRDYHRGKPLIKRTIAHNCLTFDGSEQPPQELRRSMVTQFVTRPTFDMVKMDLTFAYDHPRLRLYNRFFFLMRPGLVILVDEVRGETAHHQYIGTAVESRLHTSCDIQLRTYDAMFTRPGAALLVRPVVPLFTPGLGDHGIAMSVGEHEGLQQRHPDTTGKLKHLTMRSDTSYDPTLFVTALMTGGSAADADAKWARVKVEARRRRRVEIYHEGQTLVLDWGNRRWETYWHMHPGELPKVEQATISGPQG